jgi:hypothetical protein
MPLQRLLVKALEDADSARDPIAITADDMHALGISETIALTAAALLKCAVARDFDGEGTLLVASPTR